MIRVTVKPRSNEDKIGAMSNNEYKIYTRAEPINGKANLSVIKIIAKHFGVRQKDIIIKNPSSRKKIVEIRSDYV